MIFDPAVARLAILEALKEEFMDLMDDGKTTTAELVELNKDLTDFAAEILDVIGATIWLDKDAIKQVLVSRRKSGAEDEYRIRRPLGNP